MPTVQEGFTRLFESISAQDKENSFWKRTIDFNSNEFISSFLKYIGWLVTKTSGEEKGPEEFAAKTYVLISDLLMLRAGAKIPEELCNMLQFYFSTHVFLAFLGQKRFAEAYTWLLNSIADDVFENSSEAAERNFDIGRIVCVFNPSNNGTRYLLCQVQVEWIEGVFYFSRSFGSVHELARHILPLALSVFKTLPIENHFVNSIQAEIQALAWCTQYRFEQEELLFSEHLVDVYEHSVDQKVKKIIALQFAVGNCGFTSLSKKEWCTIVTNNFWNTLAQHEKFQILVNKNIELDEILAHFDEILNEVKAFDFEALDKNALTTSYHVNAIFNILRPTINILSSEGKISEANRLIGAYFSIPDEELIEPDNLIIIPNIVENVYYCFQDKVELLKCENEAINEITHVRNKFLSITQTLRNNIEFEAEMPARFGVPSVVDADAYCKALHAHFQIGSFKDYDLGNCGGYYISYETNLHIQNMISLECGVTLPMLKSFRKPKPARLVNSVFIWEGGTFSTELARKGIQEIFTAKGITVNWKDISNSTKEDFLVAFESNEYDVFWILGHGNFEHFQPHNSTLELAENVLVDINELLTRNYKGDNRRLLVMDICDGSTTLFNSPRSIGIGASLTGPTQSLIGHSWMIENMASLTLALLLASFLSEQLSYTEAHQKTVSKFYEGKEAVLGHLKSYITDEEVLDRIRNYEIDFRNFYYWGALAYLQ